MSGELGPVFAEPLESSHPLTTAADPSSPHGHRVAGEQILLQEFDHASRLALQALQDRSVTIYLLYVLAGVFIAAAGLGYQLGGTSQPYPVGLEALLLLGAGILSSGFFVRFLRLRRLYRDSVHAMNAVKEFFIQNARTEDRPIDPALVWQIGTADERETLATSTAFVCSIMATISTICFAGFAIDADRWLRSLNPTVLTLPDGIETAVLAGIAALCSLILHALRYRANLEQVNPATARG